jgi:hypothetical protein
MAWIAWELRSLKRAKGRDLDSNNKADRQP